MLGRRAPATSVASTLLKASRVRDVACAFVWWHHGGGPCPLWLFLTTSPSSQTAARHLLVAHWPVLTPSFVRQAWIQAVSLWDGQAWRLRCQQQHPALGAARVTRDPPHPTVARGSTLHLQKYLCKSRVASKQRPFRLKFSQVALAGPLHIPECSQLRPWPRRVELRQGLSSDLMVGIWPGTSSPSSAKVRQPPEART